MTESKEFPTAVIASLSSGICLGGFGAMHEAAEYLMGHPIWTHHFADKGICTQMQRAVIDQCPEMPTEISGVDKDNYLEKVADLEANIGKTVRLKKGSGVTAMHPLDGIPEGKPIVAIIATAPEGGK